MNCFAHALPFLDNPYFAVGCCIPDWLNAVDRKVRAREKLAAPFVDHDDEIVSAIAGGVVQHHQDDHWFHQTPVFNELSLRFSVEIRTLFGNERSMRPGFTGHVIIELFLDAYLHMQYPGKMDSFYEQVESVDKNKVQESVNLFTTRTTDGLVFAIGRFQKEKFLYDYSTDQGIIYRLNRVYDRIGLLRLDPTIQSWMPSRGKEFMKERESYFQALQLQRTITDDCPIFSGRTKITKKIKTRNFLYLLEIPVKFH